MSDTKWQDALVAKYPKQFPNGFFFECLSGWSGILDDLFSRVQAVLDADPELASQWRWSQVKSKYGSLRAYADVYFDEVEEAIEAAETASETTCETCGKPGSIVNVGGWLRATCGEEGH